jgi:transcriptional regulator with XRE-family HTH domain
LPRPNRGRSIASEANLAKRIAYEREWRGLSYEGLATLMTEHGCAIRGSAIYKIEKGDPPRRVTVDELVALARVFEVTVDELLDPVELIEERHAKELIDEFDRVGELLPDAVVRLFELWTNYLMLGMNNPELHEYVSHHWEKAAEGNYNVAAITADGVTVTGDTRLHEVVLMLSDAIQKLSAIVIDRVKDLGTENVVNAIKEGRAPHTAVKALVNGDDD